MKKELELANYLARRLKSTLYRYICIVSMLLGGVQLSQSATASPLSTENKTAFE